MIHHASIKTGRQFILTKGDNNPADDRALYNPGQLWIHQEDVMGRVLGYGVWL
jgi:signal peptidase